MRSLKSRPGERGMVAVCKVSIQRDDYTIGESFPEIPSALRLGSSRRGGTGDSISRKGKVTNVAVLAWLALEAARFDVP
jgi:hypothetical protein